MALKILLVHHVKKCCRSHNANMFGFELFDSLCKCPWIWCWLLSSAAINYKHIAHYGEPLKWSSHNLFLVTLPLESVCLVENTRHIYCKFSLPWKIEVTSRLTFGFVYCFFCSLSGLIASWLGNHVFILFLLLFSCFSFLYTASQQASQQASTPTSGLSDLIIYVSCRRSSTQKYLSSERRERNGVNLIVPSCFIAERTIKDSLLFSLLNRLVGSA